jgi:hypothetical protein
MGVVPNTLYMVDILKPSSIYRLSATDGSATSIGSTRVNEVTDIAFLGKTLYGITMKQFLKIDPSTGAATVIGKTGASDLNALAVQPGSHKIYAAGYQYPGYVVIINPKNGRCASIGKLGTGLASAGDLVFKGSILYASLNKTGSAHSWLARVNPATGEATLIGSIGYRDVWGLAVRSGALYGVTKDGEFLKINTTTGKAVHLGSNRRKQAGLTCSPLSARVAFERGYGSN